MIKKTFSPLIGLMMAIGLHAQSGMLLRDSILHDIYRTFLVYVPSSYIEGTAVPLLVNLHGTTEDADYQNSLANFGLIADTADFIIVLPNGQPNPQMYGFVTWNIFPVSSGVDDQGFLSALIDSISARYSIDANRVYFTGHSAGANMSYELACSMSERIAAIASVNGCMFPFFVSACKPKHPVPVMEIHGTADPVRTWNGAGPVTQAVNVDTLIKHWVRLNGCSPVPDCDTLPDIITTDNSSVYHYTYAGGLAGSSVEFYKVINGGHTWPGSLVKEPFGNTNMDFSACEVIWKFLSKYRLDRLSGIANASMDGELIKIYPNPVNSVLNIQSNHQASIREIRVFSILGREMLNIVDPVFHGTYTIDTSAWNKGLYITMISDGNNRCFFKVVK